ncbi:MAG: DNA/RNA non-specific endonuclease [Flavobacteriaceae bacterium]|jgi:endonuclease G|nr:DNA/RNA non-specific endonuclease [Flavobacteriaceae bacterium]
MKKTYFLTILLFTFLTALPNLSCSSDSEDSTTNEYDNFSISLTPARISATATTSKLQITTSRQWYITVSDADKSWVTFSSYQGVATSTVVLSIAPNHEKEPRTASISVSNGSDTKVVELIQEADNNEPPIGDLGWVELPKEENIKNTLFVSHKLPDNPSVRNYSLLYDTKERVAYWVAYPMHASYMGNSGRTDAWGYDPKIPQSQQAYLFSGIPGYDRGHQVPSADRTSSKNNNKTTFYFSNMTPQNKTLNQGLWSTLENKVRTWTSQCDTLYVVTGAMITSSTDQNITYAYDKEQNKIAVPKYYFKALLKRRGNNFTSVAFKMDNAAPKVNNYNEYRITVKQLEQETNFTFFPKVPDNVKNTIDENQWK